MRQVEKLDMAVEELDDALKAYFDGRYYSATVLAGAAEQLLAGYVMKHELTPAWSQMRTAITKIANGLKAREGGGAKQTSENEIGDLMNRAYNNSKHAGKKDHTIWINPRFEAQEVIDRAISNFDVLFTRCDYDLPDLPLAQRFMMESVEGVRVEQGNEDDVGSALDGNRKMTAQASGALQYNLTQDYLEVARAALTQIHGKVPAGGQQAVPELSNELANAIFSVVSISIVYSFLALESFLNYQLFRLWARRNDGSEESARFLSELGDVPEFIRLKGNDKVREVPARLKTICRLLGYPMPHEAIPRTWQRLNDLVEASRHFIVHPFPDADYFNKNMRRMMTETTAGSYVGVVEEIISFLYNKSGRSIPVWVTENQLIRFRGVEFIPIQGRT